MITSAQITNTEIFGFMAVLVFKGAATDMKYLQGVNSLGAKFTRKILVWYDK